MKENIQCKLVTVFELFVQTLQKQGNMFKVNSFQLALGLSYYRWVLYQVILNFEESTVSLKFWNSVFLKHLITNIRVCLKYFSWDDWIFDIFKHIINQSTDIMLVGYIAIVVLCCFKHS